MAGLDELGNRRGRSPSSFRHPVFGDMTNWVEQPRYPFLRRSLLEDEPVVMKASLDAVEKTLEEVKDYVEGGDK